MKERKFVTSLFVTVAFALLVASGPQAGVEAQSTSRVFPETDKSVRGKFLQYWNTHGGLQQQGYPISDELQERSDMDGKTYVVQYFERAQFELHPELAGTPHEVLLGLLGVWQRDSLYGSKSAQETPNTSAGSVLFRETGKRVGGAFLQYWQRNGGLAQQGYPITDEITEVSAIDGRQYRVQYFERAVFEMHQERRGTPFEVMLSRLGAYRHSLRYGTPQLPAAEGGRAQLNLVASDLFLAWREVETGDEDPDRKPTYNIRALDLRTGRAISVANTLNEFSKPAISGSTVVWASENKECATCDLDVYAHDLATGKTTLVATGPEVQYGPVVAGKDVAWLERGPGQGEPNSIRRKNLDSSNVSQMAQNVHSLAMSEEHLVWIADGTIAAEPDDYTFNTFSFVTMRQQSRPVGNFSMGQPKIAVTKGVALIAPSENMLDATRIESRENTLVSAIVIQSLGAQNGIAYWLERESDTVYRLRAVDVDQLDSSVLVDKGTIRDPAISGDRIFYIKDGKLVSKLVSDVLKP